jgi:hypothetical protein
VPSKSGPVVMVAVEAFSTDYPIPNFTVRKGAQLLSDHPVVRAHPTQFVSLGTSEAEIATLLGERDAAWRDEMLRSTQASAPRRVRARVGFVLDRDHPFVRSHPDWFELVEETTT